CHRLAETYMHVEGLLWFCTCQCACTPLKNQPVLNHRANFYPGIRVVAFEHKLIAGFLDGFLRIDKEPPYRHITPFVVITGQCARTPYHRALSGEGPNHIDRFTGYWIDIEPILDIVVNFFCRTNNR